MDENTRLLLTEAYNRLRELNNSFNMTRVIMDDPDLRKEAGDMVRSNREFIDRLFAAVAVKPAHSAFVGQETK